MPTSARRTDVLVDTSVAVALVVEDHEHHVSAMSAVGARRLGLSGHAAFETFSVLTRLPPPARRSAAVITTVLRAGFPLTRFLSVERSSALLAELADGTIVGGSVYDALVGAAAAEHKMPLLTNDRRALAVYRRLGVEVEVLD